MFRVIVCDVRVFLTALTCGTRNVLLWPRCFRMDVKASEIQPVGCKSQLGAHTRLYWVPPRTAENTQTYTRHTHLTGSHTHTDPFQSTLFSLELRSHMEQICVQIWIYGVFSAGVREKREKDRKNWCVCFFLMEVKRHFTLRGKNLEDCVVGLYSIHLHPAFLVLTRATSVAAKIYRLYNLLQNAYNLV